MMMCDQNSVLGYRRVQNFCRMLGDIEIVLHIEVSTQNLSAEQRGEELMRDSDVHSTMRYLHV